MSQLSNFERLAMPHMDAAFNLAFWLVRNQADAEDIVQDSYLRAFRAFHGFAGPNFKPWLLAIVRNSAFRYQRCNCLARWTVTSSEQRLTSCHRFFARRWCCVRSRGWPTAK